MARRRSMLRCPKCSSKITSKIECKECGLLFARYTMAQDKKRAEAAAKADRNMRFRQILNVALIILVIAVIGTAFTFFFGGEEPAPQIARDTPKPVVQKPAPPVPAKDQHKAGRSRGSDYFEIAKRSIVSIQTPWGTGLGFFIKKNQIITSKYLIEYSEKRLKEHINEVKQSRSLIEQEIEELEKQKSNWEEMDQGPEKDELATKIENDEERLSDALIMQEEREDQLEEKVNTLETPEIAIHLSNGNVISMDHAETSSRYDLALLSVSDVDIPYIELPPEEIFLEEEDTVYSLGTDNKAIIGKFALYHQEDDPADNFLETDSPINTRYNGSPLIDKTGYIHGVSTTSIINKNGFGSAIPIATVLNEFNL